MPILTFENVSYSYPQTAYRKDGQSALYNVTLSLEQGEFLAVMGKTGSGKTTFCKLINGIIPHMLGGDLSGTVIVNGIDTKKSSVPVLAETAGLVLDDPDAQLFTSSVFNEAAFGPENLLVPAHQIPERVNEALVNVGLSGFEDRVPSSLSGGEKQRLAIASFLTMKNKILVLDEPLCRLDPEGAVKVMSVLKDLNKRCGMTIVMSLHDSLIAQEYADKVCILNEGAVVSCDTAEKIFADKQLLEENGIAPPYEYDISSVFTPAANKQPLPASYSLLPAPLLSIELKNFSFSYNNEKKLINSINFAIKENEITAIIGPNGCGKTTMLKCIAGLFTAKKKKYSGDIFIFGRNVLKMSVPEISKEIGFVMQNPDNQLFTDSVLKEVCYALKKTGLKKQEAEKRAEDALNTVGLYNKDAFPHILSRADRTLLVLACVIAMGCKIILFDEVDVGQDYTGSLKIMNIAKELNLKGTTVIFVTHNISLVCEHAHRLIVMEKDGTISEWKKK